jgi:hypothetical protein
MPRPLARPAHCHRSSLTSCTSEAIGGLPARDIGSGLPTQNSPLRSMITRSDSTASYFDRTPRDVLRSGPTVPKAATGRAGLRVSSDNPGHRRLRLRSDGRPIPTPILQPMQQEQDGVLLRRHGGVYIPYSSGDSHMRTGRRVCHRVVLDVRRLACVGAPAFPMAVRTAYSTIRYWKWRISIHWHPAVFGMIRRFRRRIKTGTRTCSYCALIITELLTAFRRNTHRTG